MEEVQGPAAEKAPQVYGQHRNQCPQERDNAEKGKLYIYYIHYERVAVSVEEVRCASGSLAISEPAPSRTRRC